MRERAKIILIISVAAAIMLSLNIFKQPLMGLLSKYHLLPEPEPFTELYFEDHLKLPSKLKSGQFSENSYRFTVHNLEYKEADYPYEVREIAGESGRIIDSGGFSLKHDNYKTLTVDFLTSTGSGRVKIETCLTEKDQCIHFWME